MKCSQYCKWPLFIGLCRVGFHRIYSLVTPHKSEEGHGRLGLMSSFTAWGDKAVNSYDRLRNKLVVSDLLSTNTSYMFVMSNCSSCDHVCHVILFIMSYCSSCHIVHHVILWHINNFTNRWLPYAKCFTACMHWWHGATLHNNTSYMVLFYP